MKISIVKQPKWSNPKAIKIDLDFPVVDTSRVCEPNSNRVMPLNNMGTFIKILRRKTKCFKSIDISHFWVSGYIQLEFDLRNIGGKLKMKRLVKEAVIESGGFQTLEQWYEKHLAEKKKPKIFAFSGTGSNIHGGQINTGYEYQ